MTYGDAPPYGDTPHTDNHEDHVDSTATHGEHGDDATSRLRHLEDLVSQLVAHQRQLLQGIQTQFGRLSKDLTASLRTVDKRLTTVEAKAKAHPAHPATTKAAPKPAAKPAAKPTGGKKPGAHK